MQLSNQCQHEVLNKLNGHPVPDHIPGTPGLSNHRAIPGSPGMMDLFRRMGKKVIYVTNNAILPTEANVAKLTRLGYAAERVRAHTRSLLYKRQILPLVENPEKLRDMALYD